MLRWFELARQADPAAKLYLNMLGLLEDGGEDHRRQENYVRLIAWLLERHAPLDGLGVQCHIGSRLTPPTRLAAILARFGGFGLPLRITEFDVDLDDQALRAAYLYDALTVFQAEPAVIGVITWGFWAGEHRRPDAALLARDWSPSLAGMAWDDLFVGSGHTSIVAITGVDGRWSSRVTAGDYRVAASLGTAGGEVAVPAAGTVDATVVVRISNR